MKAGSRDAEQGRLLADIRKIKSITSASDQAHALEATFRESISRCANPASTRIDLDDFGQWISVAKSSAQAQKEVLSRLLDESCQSSMVQLFWEKLDHERAAVAKKAEPTLHALLVLLNNLSSKHRAAPSEAALSYMASLLLDRATQDIETRTSLVIYDVMLSVYDASVILTRYPLLYSDLINKFSAQIDIPTRRSRVCMKILRSKGEGLGLIFDAKTLGEETPPPAPQVWREWSDFAVRPMRDALLSHDLYKRNSTSVYHLTELFQLAPASVLPLVAILLDHPDKDASLPAILSALRAAKQFGLCRVGSKAEAPLEALLGSDVPKLANDFHGHPATQPIIVSPPDILAACVHASIEELQVAALSIVVESRSSIAPLKADELSVLHAFLEASFSSTHASGRGSLNALFGRLLTRMAGIGYAAEREIAKLSSYGDATKEELAPHQQALESSRAFVRSATKMTLDALHPGAPYHMVIAALTFLELMLNSGVDPSFLRDPSALKSTFGKFAQDYSLNVPIINARTVRALLSCADSTYDDIQVRALGILHRFPAPLPGLEDRKTAEQAILLKARQLLLSGRDSESTAAGSLLRVYQQVYIRRLGWVPTSLLHIQENSDSAAPEPSGSSQPALSRELALFSNLLTFLEAQISVAEGKDLLTAAKSNPVHGSLITLQKMLDDGEFWASSDAGFSTQIRHEFLRAQSLIDRIWMVTQPILCAAAPEGNSHTSGEEVDTADTEVARALAAAEGGKEGVVTESVIRKSQTMLSYSWRGMKEAAALLGKLVSSPMRKGAQTAQLVWTAEEVDEVGQRFTLWMTAVRHRGAFSTIYPAYSSAAAAILRCQWPEVQRKPHAWLHSFISKVTSPDNRVSTTRRSAGVGYAVLALVAALPLRDDRQPLDAAVDQLIRAANDCFGSTEEQIVAAHIHAINILRVLVMDSSLAEAMYPHVDTLLSLAIRRFQSPIWYIRNAGLMLFSALSPRIFPARKTNEDDPSSQLPANRFFQMYPTLYPTLTENLRTSLQNRLHKCTNATDAEQAGSLYAILFLLSRMQAVEHQEAGAVDLISLRDLVAQCLSSTDFKIREIAARAFAALTTVGQAPGCVVALLDTLSTGNENTWHGTMLAAARVLAVHAAELDVASVLGERLQSVAGTARTHSSAVQKAIVEALKKAKSTGQEVHAIVTSIDTLRERLWDCDSDFQLRTDAADEMYERYTELDNSKFDVSKEWELAASLALTSGRIPLREAALALLGHLTGSVVGASTQTVSGEFKARAVTVFSKLACTCSREEEHVESRLAAVQALSAFGPHLWSEEAPVPGTASALFKARVSFLDLLQDDDEEVRMIAANVVAKNVSSVARAPDASSARTSDALGDSLLVAARSSVASSTISVERVWQWMTCKYGAVEDDQWTRYLSTTLLPRPLAIEAALSQALNPSSALFAAERPNMFRDRENDVSRAFALCRQNSRQGRDLTSAIARRVKASIPKLRTWLGLLAAKKDVMRFVTGRLVAVQLCLAVEVAGETQGDLQAVYDEIKSSLSLDA